MKTQTVMNNENIIANIDKFVFALGSQYDAVIVVLYLQNEIGTLSPAAIQGLICFAQENFGVENIADYPNLQEIIIDIKGLDSEKVVTRIKDFLITQHLQKEIPAATFTETDELFLKDPQLRPVEMPNFVDSLIYKEINDAEVLLLSEQSKKRKSQEVAQQNPLRANKLQKYSIFNRYELQQCSQKFNSGPVSQLPSQESNQMLPNNDFLRLLHTSTHALDVSNKKPSAKLSISSFQYDLANFIPQIALSNNTITMKFYAFIYSPIFTEFTRSISDFLYRAKKEYKNMVANKNFDSKSITIRFGNAEDSKIFLPKLIKYCQSHVDSICTKYQCNTPAQLQEKLILKKLQLYFNLNAQREQFTYHSNKAVDFTCDDSFEKKRMTDAFDTFLKSKRNEVEIKDYLKYLIKKHYADLFKMAESLEIVHIFPRSLSASSKGLSI